MNLNPNILFLQTLNGLSLGMLLFMLASGLALITGLMGVVNLAQGSYYMLAAYVAIHVIGATGNFMAGVVVGILLAAFLGLVMQRLFLHRFYKNDLAQVLMTFGFLFVFQDAALWIWKGQPVSPVTPGWFQGAVMFGPIGYPAYRLFIIAFGVVLAIALWLFFERTKLGAIIRAGVDDEEMLRGLGVNVPLLFTMVFALGAGLAGLSGVLGGQVIGIYPGVDLHVLLLSFVVLIVGGLGSLKGAFVASLLVGLLDNFGKAFFPDLSQFTMFVPMALILAVKPSGLFGRA